MLRVRDQQARKFYKSPTRSRRFNCFVYADECCVVVESSDHQPKRNVCNKGSPGCFHWLAIDVSNFDLTAHTFANDFSEALYRIHLCSSYVCSPAAHMPRTLLSFSREVSMFRPVAFRIRNEID